jgi:hypothetical protein
MNPTLARRLTALNRTGDGLGRAITLALVCSAWLRCRCWGFCFGTRANRRDLAPSRGDRHSNAIVETSLLGISVIIGVGIRRQQPGSWLPANHRPPLRCCLPAGVPAYIVAYAYTDSLSIGRCRPRCAFFGWQRDVLVGIRSLAAIFVFVVVLT